MKSLMLDLETLGTNSNAIIVQIGAVFFDINTGTLMQNNYGQSEFKVNVDIQSGINLGFEADAGAMKFWFEQGIEKMTWLRNTVPITSALQKFMQFFDDDNVQVWSHASFDIPILANAFNKLMLPTPFKYTRCRDIRTLVELAGVVKDKSKPDEVKTHDALDDCHRQIRYCVECFKKLKGGK